MSRLLPLFPFYGSKYRSVPRYPGPRFARIIEPFAGSASYSLWHGARDVILVEKDPTIATLWRYLMCATPEEIRRLPLLPEVGESVDDHDLEEGARSLIGFWLNRGSASPKRSRTAYSARNDRSQLNWGARARERVAQTVPHIRAWTIIEGDFSEAPWDVATWFVDPPYVDKGRYYRKRLDVEDYERLAAFSKTRLGQVIACEGPSAAWLPFRPLGVFKSSRARAQEFIWTSDMADAGALTAQ